MSILRHRLLAACAIFALAPSPALAQGDAPLGCDGVTVCRVAETSLALRVLTRPFATLYETAEASEASVKQANLPGLKPYYVFARQDVDLSDPIAPKGWYQVGASESTPDGWIQAKDALEWRQALVAAYEPLGSDDDTRARVLGFKSIADVRAIVESDDPETEYEVALQAVGENNPPSTVITAEPEVFLDIDDQFYLFPILDWELSEGYYDDPLRFLQLASAVPGARAETPDQFTTQNPTFLAESAGSLDKLAEGVNIDIVFVMDLTNSMEPFIAFTKNAVGAMQNAVSENAGQVRFGFVGYRDDVSKMPEMEFISKNFTPTLQSATDFSATLTNQVSVVTVPSADYQEEVFAGVKTALDSQWSDKGLRFIVLVGDASSHPSNHPQNTSQLDESGIRRLADERDVRLLSVHLQDEEDSADWALAKRQYETMARNPGLSQPAYFAIDARDEATYVDVARQVADVLGAIVRDAPGAAAAVINANAASAASNATAAGAAEATPSADASSLAAATGSGGSESAGRASDLADAAPAPVTPNSAPVAPPAGASTSTGSNAQESIATLVSGAAARTPDATTDAGRQARASISGLAESALIDYLGSTAEAPRDVTFWVSDLDLTDPRKKAMDVRVLITKKNLDDVVRALEQVGAALKENKITNVGFMKALQGIVTLTSSNRSGVTFDDARLLSDTRLLPAWIASLPYRSKIMNLSDQTIAGLTPDEVLKLIDDIDAQITLYKTITEDSGAWVQLNESDGDLDRVHPMPLSQLP